VLACCVSLVTSQSCIFINGNTGDVYNLLPLQGQQFSVNSATYTYTFSPCANSCKGPQGTPAQLCQDQLGNPSSPVAPVSIWDATAQWSMVSPSNPVGGVQMTTTNGAPPNCPDSKGRAATLVFNCGATQGELQLTTEPPGAQCSKLPGYVFTLTTPYACPNVESPSGSSKLSGGWIFIIILCTLFPVYFLVGFMYGWKGKGLSGTDACPNVDFWRGLPGLIKDGFSFVISKIKGCCGGGGGSSNYDSL